MRGRGRGACTPPLLCWDGDLPRYTRQIAHPSLVPHLHVLAVRLQVRPRSEVLVVEVDVEMLRLEEVHDPNAGHGAGELAPGVERVLALERHARQEALIVALRRGADPARLIPGPRRFRVIRPARA